MRGALALLVLAVSAAADQLSLHRPTTQPTKLGDDVHAMGDTLTTVLSASEQHGTFIHLLQRAKLIPMLSRLNGSVFAPTDKAWAAWEETHRPAGDGRSGGWLGSAGLAEWLVSTDEAEAALSARIAASPGSAEEEIRTESDNQNWALQQHLLYHMLNYTLTEDEWERSLGTTETSLLHPLGDRPPNPVPGNPWTPVPTDGLLGAHGQRIRVDRPGSEHGGDRGRIGVNHLGDGGAGVWDGSGWKEPDNGSHHLKDQDDGKKKKPVGLRWVPNGVVVGLDGVLEPPKSLVETIRSLPQLSYLAKLLDSPEPLPTPLPPWIDKAPHVTLFAASDDAFEAAFDDVERSYLEGGYGGESFNRVLGPSILLAIDRDVGWKDTWSKKPTIVNAVNGALNVSAPVDGGLVVNGTAAETVDIFTSNGVIHIMPRVLVPEGFELLNSAEKVLLSRNATRFVSLLRSANLSSQYIGEPGKKNTHQWTILAPTDDAIEYFELWNGPGMLSLEPQSAAVSFDDGDAPGDVVKPNPPPPDNSPLAALLKYHVVPGKVSPKTLEDGMLLATELRTAALGGERQRLHVEVSGRSKAHPEWDLDAGEIQFGGAMVVGSPVKSGDSVIYFISSLLAPPLDVLQTTVADLQLSTYIAAVYAAGLERTTKANPGTTYFVPRNKAFAQLGLVMKYLLLPESRDELRRVLRYLSVEKLVYTPDVESGKTVLRTIQGGNIVLDKQGDNGTVSLQSPSKWEGHDSGKALPANGDLRPASLVTDNMLAETGVIHIIDSVILPADAQMTPAKLIRGSKQRVMEELMTKAGFGWILEGREPSLAELEHVGLENAIRPQGSGSDEDAPAPVDPTELALPAYTILMPTDKAFSRLNLTQYTSDPDALLSLLKLHIIPSNLGTPLPKASVEHAPRYPPRDGLPLALEDDVVYPTLLAPSARYGELAFRAWGESEWLVGVHNARSGSTDHGARTNGAGRSSVRWRKGHDDSISRSKVTAGDTEPQPQLWLGGMTLGGGVIVLDTVLIPYDPGWWERWAWLVLTVTGGAAGVSVLSISVWWWYTTTRAKREGYERVAQEEEEREQEEANRRWRRMSRGEGTTPRPSGNFIRSRDVNGNGNGHGNAIDSDEDI